jgi:ABC-type multidrug transport system, ATPase component
MISIENIEKSYGATKALKSISLEVAKGELFGLIGPDGAGKSSLMRILVTLLRPDSGKASLDGLDVVADFRKIREMVGYMPGRFSLYADLTVAENLEFFATVFGTTVEANYHLIKDIYRQIEPFKNRPAGKLSGGMKQKLALSCALIHAPKVLVLDEPTTGVDAVSRKEFWEMLKKTESSGHHHSGLYTIHGRSDALRPRGIDPVGSNPLGRHTPIHHPAVYQTPCGSRNSQFIRTICLYWPAPRTSGN